jgi:cobalamin biosynthesis protein CbiD
MKIDRHNYEEFFLLYIDNELTAEQTNSVQQFVQENPDLARELEILQQVTLKADDEIVFDGKEKRN